MNPINIAPENREGIENEKSIVKAVRQGFDALVVSITEKINRITRLLLIIAKNLFDEFTRWYRTVSNKTRRFFDQILDFIYYRLKPVLSKKRDSDPTINLPTGNRFDDIQHYINDNELAFGQLRKQGYADHFDSFSRPISQNTISDDEGLYEGSDEKFSLASTSEASRIQKLEKELEILRNQMAFLMGGKSMQSNPLVDTMHTPPNGGNLPVPGSKIPNSMPPPPPPPPPAFLRSNPGISAIKAQDLQQVKLKHLASGDSKPLNNVNENVVRKTGPNMTDVLKELNSVQLKKVQKSPGGTPLVRALSLSARKLEPQDLNQSPGGSRKQFASSYDQGSFLANALYNKFKEIRISDSFDEQDDADSTDEEDLWNE